MFIFARRSSLNLPCNIIRVSHGLRPSNLTIRRKSSTLLNSHRGTVTSHLLAGALGGFLVIIGGYTWYHFSPLRPIVETSRHLRVYAEDVKKGFPEKLKGRVIELLRKTAKAYVAVVPGAEVLVDAAFDSLGDILEQYREDVDRIAAKALEEVQRVVANKKDEADGIQTTLAIMEILKVRLSEIQALGARTQTTVGPLLETAGKEILLLSKRLGPETKHFIDQRMTQVQSVLSSQGTSSVVRTIGEKTTWLRRSFDRDNSRNPDSGTNDSQATQDVDEKGQ